MFLHFKATLVDCHIIQQWHLFCLCTFWNSLFYFRAPLVLPLNVQPGGPHNGQRNIFLCDWTVHGKQPWFMFHFYRDIVFFFLSFWTRIFCHITDYVTVLVCFHPLAGFVCAYCQVVPLFVLKTKAQMSFLFKEKSDTLRNVFAVKSF